VNLREDKLVDVRSMNVIPDWTRTTLSMGAPPANPPQPQTPEAAALAAVGTRSKRGESASLTLRKTVHYDEQ
jgi:hypothetical protein